MENFKSLLSIIFVCFFLILSAAVVDSQDGSTTGDGTDTYDTTTDPPPEPPPDGNTATTTDPPPEPPPEETPTTVDALTATVMENLNITVNATDLRDIYKLFLKRADAIMNYLGIPRDQRPPDIFVNMTDAELYGMHKMYMEKAHEILERITMTENIELYTAADEVIDSAIYEEHSQYLNMTDESIKPLVTEDEKADDYEERYSANITTAGTLEEMTEKIYEAKRAEWMRHRTYAEYRNSLGQTYERDVVDVKSVTAQKAEMTVQMIRANKAVRIEIEETTEIAFSNVDIAVNNDVADVEIVVKKHDEKPVEVEEEIESEVYEYIEIEEAEITDDDIADVGITFDVRKSWLEANGITNHSDVALFRLKVNWTELPTRKLAEDTERVYYEAFSPGLSYFAISITAAAISPIEIEIPEQRASPLEGAEMEAGESEPDIVIIRFSWMLVFMVISIILLLKYTYITKQVKNLLYKENPDDLRKTLNDYSNQKNEALNQYYRREITNEQMNQIVNEIKKKEFEVEMKIKKIQEKKESHLGNPQPQ